MKKTFKIFLFSTILLVSLFSVMHFAQGQGLVPCDNVTQDCNFDQLLALVNNVLHFIIFDLCLPLCALMFAYAGFLLITSGGEISKMNKAKRIFWNVALGFIIVLAAWLIVELILSLLGYNGSWIGF